MMRIHIYIIKKLLCSLALLCTLPVMARRKATVTLHPTKAQGDISYFMDYRDGILHVDGYDYSRTEMLMSDSAEHIHDLWLTWSEGAVLQGNAEDYYWWLGKCVAMESVIKRHADIMDRYDPHKHKALVVDAWSNGWSGELGSVCEDQYQHNTMREALVTALSFHIIHKYADRVKTCRIAQISDMPQSMLLTHEGRLVLTPVHYVYAMYQSHQGATLIPIDMTCDEMQVKNERFLPGRSDEEPTRSLPLLSATASRDSQGTIRLSLVNVDLKQSQKVTINLARVKGKRVTGKILTSESITDHNTFTNPEVVKSTEFKGVKVTKKGLKVTLPAMSIVTLEVK